MCCCGRMAQASESCPGQAQLGIAISLGGLERVMSSPSDLGELGEMLAAGLTKLLHAEVIQRIADMPGCALLRA